MFKEGASTFTNPIDEFEKAHPNIHVTIETFPYSEYQPKLTTQFSSGGGPDVYWVNTPMIASWRQDGVMEDLTSKIKAANINLSQYLPTLVNLHTFNGKLYGLPKDWDTIAYFYNADYLAQHHITVPSGLTWNPANGGTWLSFLKSLTYDTGGHSAASPGFNASSVATYGTDSPNEMQWGFEPYLAENGVKLQDTDDDGKPTDLYNPLTGKRDVRFTVPNNFAPSYRTPTLVSVWAPVTRLML